MKNETVRQIGGTVKRVIERERKLNPSFLKNLPEDEFRMILDLTESAIARHVGCKIIKDIGLPVVPAPVD